MVNGDTSQHEVERYQSFTGDAKWDGGDFICKHKRPYEGIPDRNIEEMSLD